MKSSDIVEALKKKYTNYGRSEQWAIFPELRIGTGYKGILGNVEQRLDFFAMALYPSLHFEKIAFEIKVSRTDFLKEMKQPLKRRPGLLFSNKFYFAAPKDMLKIEEIPVECGLLEFWESDQKEGKDFQKMNGKYMNSQIKVPAPWRDTMSPNWAFVASLARRIAKLENPVNM